MAKTRAYGSDAQVLDCIESSYGEAVDGSAGGVYTRVSFKSFSVGADRPLGDDPLLGQGSEAQDPFYDAITVAGDVEVPIDLQGFGYWLKKLFGAPVTTGVKATGTLTFSGQPANNDTITLNGVVWTFVTGAAGAAQTQIGANLAATLTALATDLNASGNAEVAKCTYTGGATTLAIERDVAGPGGNTFTLAEASSVITRSAATLTGGHYSHAFTSGGAIPSSTMQLGHPELTTPRYFNNTGVKANTLAFGMARTGPANATIGLIAQGEEEVADALDDDPLTYSLTRFNNGSGTILIDGVEVANITAGSFNYSNGVEPVETIRDDGKIDGADENLRTSNGSVDVRFGTDTTFSDAEAAESPVALKYRFSIPNSVGGYQVEFHNPRVFLPKKKGEVSGPGGISKSYEWKAARDESSGFMTRVTLKNDVASYA